MEQKKTLKLLPSHHFNKLKSRDCCDQYQNFSAHFQPAVCKFVWRGENRLSSTKAMKRATRCRVCVWFQSSLTFSPSSLISLCNDSKGSTSTSTFCKTLLNSQLTGTFSAWSVSTANEEEGEELWRVVKVGKQTNKTSKQIFQAGNQEKINSEAHQTVEQAPRGKCWQPHH